MAPAETEVLAGKELTNPISQAEPEPLLRTKLFVPGVPASRIARPRLDRLIDAGLDRALILVIAPAGYGKTTLVSGWLQESRVASAWLSLDEDDNDPIRFLQYLITALHQVVPAIQLDLLGALQESRPSPYLTLMNILINQISEHAPPFVLVLDDFHTLQSQPVLDLCMHLIERIPPQMHIAVLSRTDPPVSISRLRARGQLIEIRADQLRFTPAEIAQFLDQAINLRLSPDDLNALEVRTEGWIAGIQLAAISMAASSDVHNFVSAFTGSHSYIMDYLVEEVLRFQKGAVRLFLLQTSILDRMCAPLCDSVLSTEDTEPVHSQAILELLAQLNLFIIPLDNERRWFRYHHLFADVLSRHLEQAYPHLLPELHCRASRWYEQTGYSFDAIRHALLAGDQERAASLLDQNGCLLLMRGEVVVLLRWIEAVEPFSKTYPWIAIQKGWALCLTGQPDLSEEPLQAAEQIINGLPVTDDVSTMRGALIAARAHRANIIGDPRQAAQLASQALDCLPATGDLSCGLRSAAISILGDASWLEGNLAEAQLAYTEAVQISRVAGNVHMRIIAGADLAEILMEQGRLQQAARLFMDLLQIARLPDGQISPLVDRVYSCLARINYEWNRLDDAAGYAQRCIESAARWGSIESQAVGQVLLAELAQAQGRPERAREALQAAGQFIDANPLTSWRSSALRAALARLWIALGNMESAADLLQKSNLQIDEIHWTSDLPYLQEPAYLVLLRMHLAKRDYERALGLSAWLQQVFEQKQRDGRLIETLILRALAFQGKRDLDQALAVLEKAITIARPEGYRRIFLAEGEPMVKLLYQARARKVGSEYAAELLNSISEALPARTLLLEPLTERELQVLKLIEEGYTNQEIAAMFVISLPTVKRHISNLYAKLGANSRTQAILRGKELNLFQ